METAAPSDAAVIDVHKSRSKQGALVAAAQASVRAGANARSSQMRRTVVTTVGGKTSADEACLLTIYGAELGKKYQLGGASRTIGRATTCDIIIDQESISRRHAEITNVSRSYILRDLDSTNGTWVNDEPVDEYVLRDGDFLKLGRTILKFLSGLNIENHYHDELYRLTTTDGLTRILNKQYLRRTLEREFERARRHKAALSLIMFDIDHFKRVNDTYGHLAGDHILKAMADAVRATIKKEHYFGRYGGEEFSVVMPQSSSEQAADFGEVIRRTVETTPFAYDGQPIAVTVSVGLASLEADIENEDRLIFLADAALYRAKASGRNRVETGMPVDRAMKPRLPTARKVGDRRAGTRTDRRGKPRRSSK